MCLGVPSFAASTATLVKARDFPREAQARAPEHLVRLHSVRSAPSLIDRFLHKPPSRTEPVTGQFLGEGGAPTQLPPPLAPHTLQSPLVFYYSIPDAGKKTETPGVVPSQLVEGDFFPCLPKCPAGVYSRFSILDDQNSHRCVFHICSRLVVYWSNNYCHSVSCGTTFETTTSPPKSNFSKTLGLVAMVAAPQQLARSDSPEPFVREIVNVSLSLENTGCTLCFQWVPSRSGIRGNEHVDVLAGAAHAQEPSIFVDRFVEPQKIIRVCMLPHPPCDGTARGCVAVSVPNSDDGRVPAYSAWYGRTLQTQN